MAVFPPSDIRALEPKVSRMRMTHQVFDPHVASIHQKKKINKRERERESNIPYRVYIILVYYMATLRHWILTFLELCFNMIAITDHVKVAY